MIYSHLTRHHFQTAGHAGVLTGPGVRRGAAGSRAQGTWVQFDLKIDPNEGLMRLRTVRFLAYACPHVIAVSDWVAQQAAGKEVAPTLPEAVRSLRERFDVPVEKLGRLLIVEDAWRAAVLSPSS
jgi:NifU-like protein involved in Fe-S cluster formation